MLKDYILTLLEIVMIFDVKNSKSKIPVVSHISDFNPVDHGKNLGGPWWTVHF